jgi:beta-exotoxin I transport system ATP-binding protein
VRDITAADSVVRCTVRGEVDPLIKTAARHHVVALSSDEADLEDVFLSYYQEADRDAA